MAFSSLIISIYDASGQTVEEQAQLVIANLPEQIRTATDDLYFYWENITDATRYMVLEDIGDAWENYGIARSLYDFGDYNISLEFAYWATLLAHRAIYQIFLNIAETHIERANSTINEIPSYIPQPIEAKNKLEQACELYDDAFLKEVFVRRPSVEEAPYWINAIGRVKDELYWNQEVTVVKLADEAWKYAVDWREAQEASIHPQIRDKVSNVSSNFYSHLMWPFVVGLVSSSLFCIGMMRKFSGWLRKKSGHKILWKGDLWRPLELGSIIATLSTLAIFSGLLWEWIESVRGLPETYEILIPTGLIDVLDVLLWLLISLLVVSSIVLIINKFKWQKRTGLSFTMILVLEILLSLTIVGLGGLSLGQIAHSALL